MIVSHTPPSPQSEEARRKSQNFYTPTKEQLLLLNDKKLEEAAEILNISISKLVYLRRSYGIRKYTKKEELEGSSHFQIKGFGENSNGASSSTSSLTTIDPKKPNPLRKTKSGNDISDGLPVSPSHAVASNGAIPNNQSGMFSSSNNAVGGNASNMVGPNNISGIHPAMINRSNSTATIVKQASEFQYANPNPPQNSNLNNINNIAQQAKNFLMNMQNQQQQQQIAPLIPSVAQMTTTQINPNIHHISPQKSSPLVMGAPMLQHQFSNLTLNSTPSYQPPLQLQHQFSNPQLQSSSSQFGVPPASQLQHTFSNPALLQQMTPQQQQFLFQQKIQQQQMMMQQQQQQQIQQQFPQIQPQPQGFVPPKLVKLPSLSEMTDPNNFVYKQSASEFFAQHKDQFNS